MPDKKAIPGIPFGSTVGDSLDLVRKMWGMTGLPGIPSPSNLAQMAVRLPQNLPNMVAPTLDVGELEKRIADLKAVEQWLQLNVGMLRTTIQSLEVQRATIATLKGISGAMLPSMLKGKPEETAALLALQQQFAAMQAMQQAATVPAAAPAPAPVPAAAEPEPPKRKARRRTHSARGVPAPLNPGVWWNAMQDQFARIAATAATAAAEAAAEEDAKALAKAKAVAAATASKKPAAKPRSRGR
ncbi:MAG: hypothetical protein RR101_04465 [Burkholderiaceae bacterium]